MERILNPIIEITRQRDLDSLERCLVTTMTEVSPACTVSIYKLLKKNIKDGFEEVVGISISTAENGNQNVIWDKQPRNSQLEKHIEECLQNSASVSYKVDHKIHRLLIPINCNKEVVGVLRVDSLQPLDSYKQLLTGFIRIYENYLAILNESERDKLTGLLNRRTFDSKLDRLLKSQQLHDKQCSSSEKSSERRKSQPNPHAWLAMIDVDHFKRINDGYGHLYGDEVLLQLSQLLREGFRDSDLLFRFGGEEFVVILGPVPFESAQLVLDRFRKKVANYNFPQIGKVTISIGFEKISLKDFPPAILELADKALYYAKEHGRNCLHNYNQLIQSGKLRETEITSSVDLFSESANKK